MASSEVIGSNQLLEVIKFAGPLKSGRAKKGNELTGGFKRRGRVRTCFQAFETIC